MLFLNIYTSLGYFIISFVLHTSPESTKYEKRKAARFKRQAARYSRFDR